MIIWGSRGQNVILGVREHRDCEKCQTNRPFRLMLQYRYGHLYYVFRWVTQKQYFLACDGHWSPLGNQVATEVLAKALHF